MKGLRAFGPVGRLGDQFNWCEPYEPVALDGFVCCSAVTCGCNRSFIGQKTRRGTTLAIVSEITEPEQTQATKALTSEKSLPQDFPLGTVLRAEALDNEWLVHPVNKLDALRFSIGVYTCCSKDVYAVVQQELVGDDQQHTKIIGFSNYEWVARDMAKMRADGLQKEYEVADGQVIVEEGDNAGITHPASCLSGEFVVISKNTSFVFATVWVQKLDTVFAPIFETLTVANASPVHAH